MDYVGYILAALRNAGVVEDREEAAHDVVVQLLVQPGRLFTGYDPDGSGTMEARFALSVRNAVLNVLRARRRWMPVSRAVGGVEAVPDRRRPPDDDTLAAFLRYLKAEVGNDAVRLLDRRLDGVSLRQLVRDPVFNGSSAWALQRLMASVRDAAVKFARRQGDDEFLAAVERLTAG